MFKRKLFSAVSIAALLVLSIACSADGGGSNHDSDYYEPEDDGSVQLFTSTFEKLQHANGSLEKFNQDAELYTIQVNNAFEKKVDTGYIRPIRKQDDKDNNRSAGENPFALFDDSYDKGISPSFVYEPKEKLFSGNISSRAASSPEKDAPDTSKFTLGDSWTFDIAKKMDETNNGETKEGILKAIGEHCLIFLSKDETDSIPTSKCKSLAKNFDDMYPMITNVMGRTRINEPLDYFQDKQGNKHKEWPASIVDENGKAEQKIIIFVYDCFDDKEEGNVIGYFWKGDLLTREAVPYSNQCRMFYIDSYYVKDDIKNNTYEADTTLAHEFTHMINAIQKKLEYQTWYTEMLAMLCEDFMDSSFFKLNPTHSSTTYVRLGTYNWAFLFGIDEKYWTSGEYVNSNYANTYAFGAYLMRNYGGIKLINRIATNESKDKESITEALKYCGFDETYDSVFAKFGQILVNTEGGEKSLNKSPYNTSDYSEYFGNYKYKVVPLDLNDYSYKETETTVKFGPRLNEINKWYQIFGRGIEVKHFGKVSDYKYFYDSMVPHSKSVDLYIYIK